MFTYMNNMQLEITMGEKTPFTIEIKKIKSL